MAEPAADPEIPDAPSADPAAGMPPTSGLPGLGDDLRQRGRPRREPSPPPSVPDDDEEMWAHPGNTRQGREAVPEPMPIPTRNSDGAQGNGVRIGLWGASRSGKTTVISALPIAAMQTRDTAGRWVVSGVGRIATDVLTDGVQRLTSGRFPAPTDDDGTSIMWSFQGIDAEPAVAPRQGRKWRAQKTSPSLVDFTLELQDVNGESFRHGTIVPAAVDNLARSSGLIYLFDPVLDDEQELRSFEHFYTALQHVTSRVTSARRMDDGLLPHHVSVLITKFDDPAFFKSAVRAHWVNQDQTGARMPYVPIEQGAAFFDWVCDERQGGTAPLVRNALRTFFHRDRIEYFACSAIGFRLNPNGVFDYNDYVNAETVDGEARIRSAVRPVNVLEPLIRLERRIRLGLPAAR